MPSVSQNGLPDNSLLCLKSSGTQKCRVKHRIQGASHFNSLADANGFYITSC